ncbi:glycerate kinase [Gordonia sp. HY002]|uniref:glycerate kinase family protein n=1 Tax=Gordonia zhenghanii TaxID=2911516 RepID=UPI001EF001A0|nr:glycerate kinase [Gordonia zhenghanii]MCF8570825.1 glycerate kinase [Gordonia zhenghanii]MCF8605311.1 glycerate kinase [Gordonia zhenghanii]
MDEATGARGATVVVAPDEFGGTLSATQAAAAIVDGWRSARPNDTFDVLPQSDGGPGFVAVLEAAGVVSVRTARVAGPMGDPVTAEYGVAADGTAYLEAAQACGLAILGEAPSPETAASATTFGVGQLVQAALADRPPRIVVGLGGSATTDGGRGALDALGGPAAAAELLRDVDVVVASDVDNPLLGVDGAATVFSPQKGADAATAAVLEDGLTGWADDLAAIGRDVREESGAGAAGGLGAALLWVGGRRRPGADVVGDATDRRSRMAAADLVVTGEGRFDGQTVRGKVIAALAAEAGSVPIIVLAGQVRGDTRIEGIAEVWSVADHVGSASVAMTDAAPSLASLAARVAARWSAGES